jgi:hypothetical protein
MEEVEQGKLDKGPIQATLAWRAGGYLRQPLAELPEALQEAAGWITPTERRRIGEGRVEEAIRLLKLGALETQVVIPDQADRLVALVQRDAPHSKDDLKIALHDLMLALYRIGADGRADALHARHGPAGAVAEQSEVHEAKKDYRNDQLFRFSFGQRANMEDVGELKEWVAEGWFSEDDLRAAAQQHLDLQQPESAWTTQLLWLFPGLMGPQPVEPEALLDSDDRPSVTPPGADHTREPHRGLTVVPPREPTDPST